MMQLEEFKRAVKKLANGRYHTVQLNITEYHDGEVKYNYAAYIGDVGWTKFSNSTPEDALTELNLMKKSSAKLT